MPAFARSITGISGVSASSRIEELAFPETSVVVELEFINSVIIR